MAFSCKALHIRSSLTNFRKFPEPEILTVIRKKKGRLKGHFRAKVPVRKGKTAILTSHQQPTGLHRSFRAVGPNTRARSPWVRSGVHPHVDPGYSSADLRAIGMK